MGFEAHFFFAKMENELKNIVEEYFKSSEYKIVDLLLSNENGAKILEIFADNIEGIKIDDLVSINRELNEIVDTKLETSDVSKLIVSSPGAERSFRYLWQLRKHIERVLEIELNDGEKIEGKLISVEEIPAEIIFLEITKKEKSKKATIETRTLNFKDIKESRVKISFSNKK